MDTCYTIILDYAGGTYISQARAPNPQVALRVWRRECRESDLQRWNLEREELEFVFKGFPVPLDGLQSAWCTSASGKNGLILINIIATQPPTEI